jgi:hypothetical protein
MRRSLARWAASIGAVAFVAVAPAAGAGTTAPAPQSLDGLLCPAGIEDQVGGAVYLVGGEDEPLFLSVQGPCTVIRQCGGGCNCPGGGCTCQDVDIDCTAGANGSCESGPGGSCGGWVQCTGQNKEWCPTQQCPPACGGAPSCSTHTQCTSYCSPDPPFCSSGGCCICI